MRIENTQMKYLKMVHYTTERHSRQSCLKGSYTLQLLSYKYVNILEIVWDYHGPDFKGRPADVVMLDEEGGCYIKPSSPS